MIGSWRGLSGILLFVGFARKWEKGLGGRVECYSTLTRKKGVGGLRNWGFIHLARALSIPSLIWFFYLFNAS